jgi:hypothetical protein
MPRIRRGTCQGLKWRSLLFCVLLMATAITWMLLSPATEEALDALAGSVALPGGQVVRLPSLGSAADLAAIFPAGIRMQMHYYNFRYVSTTVKWRADVHIFDGNSSKLKRGWASVAMAACLAVPPDVKLSVSSSVLSQCADGVVCEIHCNSQL